MVDTDHSFAGYNPVFAAAVNSMRKQGAHELEEYRNSLREQQLAIHASLVANKRNGDRLPVEWEDYREMPVRSIIRDVALKWGYSPNKIIEHNRMRDLVNCRHTAIAACYATKLSWSLPMLGRAFQRDHTTIIYAVKKLNVWRKE